MQIQNEIFSLNNKLHLYQLRHKKYELRYCENTDNLSWSYNQTLKEISDRRIQVEKYSNNILEILKNARLLENFSPLHFSYRVNEP